MERHSRLQFGYGPLAFANQKCNACTDHRKCQSRDLWSTDKVVFSWSQQVLWQLFSFLCASGRGSISSGGPFSDAAGSRGLSRQMRFRYSQRGELQPSVGTHILCPPPHICISGPISLMYVPLQEVSSALLLSLVSISSLHFLSLEVDSSDFYYCRKRKNQANKNILISHQATDVSSNYPIYNIFFHRQAS